MNHRTARAEAEIASLESEFRTKLIAALRDCANGRWGLFGQNEHLLDEGVPDRKELLEIGASIEELRRKAEILEPFELYVTFKSKCGRQGANAPGEPRLAKKWLEEFGEKLGGVRE
jgi:hypothetical protein